MTIPSDTTYSGPYLANGVTTVFPYAFRPQSTAEIEVVLVDDATGAETAIVGGWTASAIREPGNVTFDVAPNYPGQGLYIRVNPLMTQPVDFQNQGPFLAESVAEAYDRDTQRAQVIDRGYVRLPFPDVSVDFPPAIARRGGLMVFDDNAAALPNVMTQADALNIFRGDPGSSTLAVGLFTSLSTLNIPVGTDRIQTSGHGAQGKGGGNYSYMDPAVYDYGTLTEKAWRTQTSNGRWFQIDESWVHPDHLGAKGDGVTVDTAAMLAHAAYPTEAGVTSVGLRPGRNYLVDASIAYPADIHFFGGGATVTYNGANDKVCLSIGTSGNRTDSRYCYLPKVTNANLSDWSNDECVGVSLYNFLRCHIWAPEVGRFTVGLECRGDGSGFSYNNVNVGNLISNKYAKTCRVRGALGFVNENSFYGGRYGTISTDNVGSDAYGVRMFYDTGGTAIPNNNRYFGPAFELQNPGVVVRVPFKIDAGRNNFVYAARHESGRGPFALIDGNQSVLNIFHVGYKSGANVIEGITETTRARHNRYLSYTNYQNQPETWNSGDLLNHVTGYSTTLAHIAGPFFFAPSGGGAPSSTASNTLIATAEDSVKLAAGSSIAIGMRIDTSVIKRWVIRSTVKVGSANPYMWFACFDAAGTRLDNSGGTDYVNGAVAGGTLTYSASYGKVWYSGGPVADMSVTFDAAVQEAYIYFSGGSGACFLRGITLMTPDTPLTHGIAVMPAIRGAECRRAVIDPTTCVHGSYLIGEQIANATPGATAAPYWRCTGSGRLAPAWAITTVYVIGEVVTNDAGKVYIATTGGTSAGAGGPAGVGVGIADNTVVWKYVGTLATFLPGPTPFAPSLTAGLAPANVAANTSAEQNFAVTGLKVGDRVSVNGPAPTAGTGLVGARVSAADTLSLTWGNYTAGALAPAAGVYNLLVTRPS